MINDPSKPISQTHPPVPPAPPKRHISVRETMSSFSRSAQVPDEMALTNILAAVACVCQGLIDVAYPDGSPMPTSLVLFTVAASGEGKTPVQNMAFQAIRRSDQARRLSHDVKASNEYAAAFEVWDTKRKALKGAVAQLLKKGEDSAKADEALRNHLRSEPQRPLGSKLLYDDMTPSGLLVKLGENWPYACVNNTNAAAAMFGSAFEDLTLFNKLSDGDSIVRDRASAASLELHGARLTINVAVQPESCRKFLTRQGGFARHSGFLPRALIVLPASLVGKRNVGARALSFNTASMAFDMRITALLERLAARSDSGNFQRTTVYMSLNAQMRWSQFAQEVENRSAFRMDLAELRDHASKMPAIVLRIAALLEYFERDSTCIDLDSLETAIHWGQMFLESARNLYAAGPTEAEQAELDAKMLDWMRKFTAGVSAVLRGTITSHCPNAFRGNKALIDETLNRLVAAGQIFRIAAPRGGVAFVTQIPPSVGGGVVVV